MCLPSLDMRQPLIKDLGDQANGLGVLVNSCLAGYITPVSGMAFQIWMPRRQSRIASSVRLPQEVSPTSNGRMVPSAPPISSKNRES